MNAPLRAPARAASFDRRQQHRRAMLAKVHIAKKQLQLDEDDYRQLLLDEAGVDSAGDGDGTRDVQKEVRAARARGAGAGHGRGARGARAGARLRRRRQRGPSSARKVKSRNN